MTGFEPRFSGVGSDRSINCATTTTAQYCRGITLLVNLYFRLCRHRNRNERRKTKYDFEFVFN